MLRLVLPAVLILVFALSACASHSSAPLIPSSPIPPNRHAAGVLPLPVDVGRRAARRPVSVVLLLRYNHEAQLDELLDALARGERGYLTRAEFAGRFAPTPQQQDRVVRTLRASGFSVVRTYANRTLIDANAPSAVVERFFNTEIHDFQQGRYGTLFANVRPLTIPPALAPIVAAADANRLILMHPDLYLSDGSGSGNLIANPGFERGKLSPWTTCHSTSQSFTAITKQHPHTGKFDAYAGTFKGGSEPNGIVSVCQLVTIPAHATLKAWTWGVSNDNSSRVAEFAVLFNPSNGRTIKTFYQTRQNDRRWVSRGPFDVSAFAGKQVYVAFGVVGSSRDAGKAIGQYVDDVSLTRPPTPSPPPPSAPCPAAHTGPTPAPNKGPDAGWGPAAVNAGFCMPFNYGYTGAGQTAAIVIDSTVKSSDLSNYLSYYGITQTGSVTNVSIDGASLTNDSEGEATLDLETIASLAPAANVIVYVVSNLNNQGILDAYNRVLTDAKATVVNSSFGGCEVFRGDSSFAKMSEAIAKQGAALAVTYSASSGDQGADCFDGSKTKFPFGVAAPASNPHFVGVGGTQSTASVSYGEGCLQPGKPIANRVVWNDCVGAGGGGISTVWATPKYQHGVGGVSTAGRNVPDIALPAAYDDICFGCLDISGVWFGWSLIWGTSWSSPTYVAMQTEINQACGKQWGIGTIYGAYTKSGYNDFMDVNKGNNLWQSPYAGSNKAYVAGNAFDVVSGFGIPLGMQLAQTHCSAPAIR